MIVLVPIAFGQSTIISEDFSNGLPAYFTSEPGGATVMTGVLTLNGCLQLATPSGQKTFSRANGLLIEADINIQNAGRGDFNIWGLYDTIPNCNTGPLNGYYTGWFPQGSDSGLDIVAMIVNSNDPVFQRAPNLIQGNRWQHIKLEFLTDGTINTYVDGQKTMSIKDNTYTSGLISLRSFGAVDIDNLVVKTGIAPATCYPSLPAPILKFSGTTDYLDAFGNPYTRYNLSITNASSYPTTLFAPAPRLPPCGQNTNSARTWVTIYSNTSAVLEAFCALTSPTDLNMLWFALPRGQTPPGAVYVALKDRQCNNTYTSGLTVIPVPVSFCVTGNNIEVMLAGINPKVVSTVKPWEVAYSPLALTFTVFRRSTEGALCEAQSNSGALDVYARQDYPVSVPGFPVPVLPPWLLHAKSITTATLSIFPPSPNRFVQTCMFGTGVSNDCLLNGSWSASSYNIRWSSPGFQTTYVGVKTPFSTGPLTFWANLDALALSPTTHSMDQIVQQIENYFHATLIDNLPAIATYGFIQDPGNIRLMIINSQGLTAGFFPDGRITTDISPSYYFPSDSNPAIMMPAL